MSSREEVISEELEALESIYIDELERLSEDEVRIRIDPEEDLPAAVTVGAQDDEAEAPPPYRLHLDVKFTGGYPDEVPELRLQSDNDRIGDDGLQQLTDGVKQVAEESLGMAMVFALASHLREALTDWIKQQREREEREAAAKRDAEIEAEQEKFRGTAVTVERFMEWRKKFEEERRRAAARQEEEKLKGMTPKEREEYKRLKTKPSGKELFARGTVTESASARAEAEDEEGEEVDWDLYNREERERQRRQEEEERELASQVDTVQFDSDDE